MNRDELFRWCETHAEEQLALLKKLAAIPAPSNHEEKRAQFIKEWLEKNGASGVTVDEALNVLLPFGDGSKIACVYAAHTDVVFPDTEPLPVKEEGGRLFAPGVGDDTANVVALMLIAKYLLSKGLKPVEPVLFVFNSGEEGLGNLKGVRRLFDDRPGQIREFVSFDGTLDGIVNRAVGSERWRIKAETCGGHSYGAFGNPNAIAWMGKLIAMLDAQPLPKAEGRKTTYNFGVISGGTSVNTIAQSAEMLYEYRSDELSHLALMHDQMKKALEECDGEKAHFSLELVGRRPCAADVDPAAHERLLKRCEDAVTAACGKKPERYSSSTDANIPLSRGIPATTLGLYIGEKAHTREENLEISSLPVGLKIGLLLIVSSHFAK